MEVKLKAIKRLVELGIATDITEADDLGILPISRTIVYHSFGVNGLNGVLVADYEGKLYAVTKRNSNLFKLAR